MLPRHFRLASTAIVGAALLSVGTPALAQSSNRSSLTSILLTWLPFLTIIALWWFFMRRISPGKGGYTAAMQRSQETSATIADRLGRIAESLERIAAAIEASDGAVKRTEQPPGG